MRLDGLSICVTGGMGFVGSQTAKCLQKMGAYVIVVDRRYVDGREKFCDKFIQGDYADDVVLSQLEEHQCHGFVHCAGSSLVGPSMTNPSEYYNNNVIKTIKLLDNLTEWSIKPFMVFSSSAAVYGDPFNIPIKEDTIKFPINPYGMTKLMIENILYDYSSAYGIKSHSLRYFNACGADVWEHDLGPEELDTHLIPKIFEAFHNDHPFTLYGADYNTTDGTCVRDYIHVCDLALAHGTSCKALAGGAMTDSYNLGTSNGYSNLQIIEEFRRLVGPIKIYTDERRPGDPDILVADASRYENEFNWKASYSDISTIISSTNEYYKLTQTNFDK